MAKKRILNKGRKTIRNAHLIGKGGKQLRPINGSYLKAYNKTYGKAKSKVQIKANISKASKKSVKGLVQRKPSSYAKSAVKAKVKTTRVKGMEKMKARMNKTPSPSMTMQKRKVMKKKPPTKGRGR